MDVSVDPQAVAAAGVGLGSIIAVVCSWERNRSIVLAIVHSWFSWFYVLWFAISRRPEEKMKFR